MDLCDGLSLKFLLRAHRGVERSPGAFMRAAAFAAVLFFVFCATGAAAPAVTASGQAAPAAKAAKDEWVWIQSDEKYGKFYAPSDIKKKNLVRGIATCLFSTIKTSYTFAGAKETIENYGIQGSIPDPRTLAYSIARVNVFPQTRLFEYLSEDFYDAAGKVIWSRVYDPPKSNEINTLAFDEDYYIAIVDYAFRHGERARKDAEDRWITLWTAASPGGVSSTAMADTTTMRLEGNNLIYWEWMETKDSTGKVVEAKFMKKAINHVQGTQKIILCKYWDPNSAELWRDIDDDLDGRFSAITEGSKEYPGLVRLRAFIKGYQFWLNRYRTDLPDPPKKKAAERKSGETPKPEKSGAKV